MTPSDTPYPAIEPRSRMPTGLRHGLTTRVMIRAAKPSLKVETPGAPSLANRVLAMAAPTWIEATPPITAKRGRRRARKEPTERDCMGPT